MGWGPRSCSRSRPATRRRSPPSFAAGGSLGACGRHPPAETPPLPCRRPGKAPWRARLRFWGPQEPRRGSPRAAPLLRSTAPLAAGSAARLSAGCPSPRGYPGRGLGSLPLAQRPGGAWHQPPPAPAPAPPSPPVPPAAARRGPGASSWARGPPARCRGTGAGYGPTAAALPLPPAGVRPDHARRAAARQSPASAGGAAARPKGGKSNSRGVAGPARSRGRSASVRAVPLVHQYCRWYPQGIEVWDRGRRKLFRVSFSPSPVTNFCEAFLGRALGRTAGGRRHRRAFHRTRRP